MAVLSEIEISPLDKIRQTEAEIAGALAAAREASGRRLVDARAAAKRLVQQAREEGKREGQARYNEVIVRAEEEAATILSKAQSHAKELRRQGQQVMDAGVDYALNIIIGGEDGKEK